MSIQQQLLAIKENGLRELENFSDAKELDAIRVRYLGKKGELTAILKQMGKLSPEERPVVGQLANEVRGALEAAVAASQEKLKEKQDKADAKVLKKEPAETPVEASAPVETPAPVVDTTTGEVQDVEVTPVADAPQGYAVECPVSPEPFGSEGWREWTAELRDYARQYRDETGYPLYYPTLPVNTVSVQYMNETVETGVAAGSVDWAFGGVIRWKIAS